MLEVVPPPFSWRWKIFASEYDTLDQPWGSSSGGCKLLQFILQGGAAPFGPPLLILCPLSITGVYSMGCLTPMALLSCINQCGQG